MAKNIENGATARKLKRVQDPDIPWPGRVFHRGQWRTKEQIALMKESAREKSSSRTEWKEERERRRIETINAAVQVEEAGAGSAKDEDRIRWVWKHLFDNPLPKAPDRETASLLKLALLDQRGWADRYLAPILNKRQREDADIEGDRQDREVKKLALEWLNRHKFVPCPACGGDGGFNTKYLYSVAAQQDLTDGGGI